MEFFLHPASFVFLFFSSKQRHSKSDVIRPLFFAQFIFSFVDNDTDITKTHLNKAEQIIKPDFCLHLQNTEYFAVRASSYSYILKALWDGQGKIKMYYGMPRVKK